MPNPLILVHGLYDTAAKFGTLGPFLQRQGWEVHCLNLTPNDGRASLTQLAHQVANYIDRTFPGDRPLDLLGFSMGGLVTRYYLQRLGGSQRVERYISISAPNQGTLLAFSLPLPGIGEMCWNSPFLQDLNQDHHPLLAPLKTTVIWTPFDAMIIPAHSSQMGLGQEVVIPVPVHSWMVHDPRCLTAIAEGLRR